MTSAKELHDWIQSDPLNNSREIDGKQLATILRALSLLASVESADGIVRELRDLYKWCSPQYGDPMKKAAALIVAQRDEIASLRKHAEAMANFLTIDVNGAPCADPNCEPCAMVKAYRAAHSKDAP